MNSHYSECFYRQSSFQVNPGQCLMAPMMHFRSQKQENKNNKGNGEIGGREDKRLARETFDWPFYAQWSGRGGLNWQTQNWQTSEESLHTLQFMKTQRKRQHSNLRQMGQIYSRYAAAKWSLVLKQCFSRTLNMADVFQNISSPLWHRI